MTYKLFKDFLINRNVYIKCQNYWHRLVLRLEEKVNQKDEWHRWIPTHFENGTPFELDGNPIYDARSSILNRAFRIIQHPCLDENDIEIVCWIKTYEAEFSELPKEEIIINMSLTRESIKVAKSVLYNWMQKDMTKEIMEDFISKINHII